MTALYIGSAGNDNWDGLTPQTLKRNIWDAGNACPMGQASVITPLDAGPYYGPINWTYWRGILLDASALGAKAQIVAVDNGTNLAVIQDVCIGGFKNCSFSQANGVTGCNAGYVRQTAIGDFVDCEWFAFATHLAIHDASLNIGGVNYVRGSAANFITNNGGKCVQGGAVHVHGTLSFSAFEAVQLGGVINNTGSFATWNPPATYPQVNISGGTITKPSNNYAIPGDPSKNLIDTAKGSYFY